MAFSVIPFFILWILKKPYMKKIVVIITILIFTATSYAIKIDSSYIKCFDKKTFTIKFFLGLKSSELGLRNNEVNKTLKLVPNVNNTINLGFSYKWLGLSLGFTPPISKRDDWKYGKTQKFDFQFNAYGKWFVAKTYFQIYKGFYVSNPQTFIKDWNKEVYPQVPSARTLNLGGNFLWVIGSKHFSVKSIYVMNELQKKSSNSPLLGLGFNLSQGSSDYYFAPQEWVATHVLDTLHLLKSYGIMSFYPLYGGWTWLKVWGAGKFFINFSFTIGLGGSFGYGQIYYKNKTSSIPSGGFAVSTDAKLGLGGNIGKNDRFYWQLYLLASTYNYDIGKYYKISPLVKSSRLGFGYRFFPKRK